MNKKNVHEFYLFEKKLNEKSLLTFDFLTDGPYAAFGGRDASRGLATFSVVPGKDEYDDLSDLNTAEMNSILEWEEQFKGKTKTKNQVHKNLEYLKQQPEAFFPHCSSS